MPDQNVTFNGTVNIPDPITGPQGEQGIPGIQGQQGQQGIQGIQGVPGAPATARHVEWTQPGGGGSPTLDCGNVPGLTIFQLKFVTAGTGIGMVFSNVVLGATMLVLVETDVALSTIWDGKIKWVDGVVQPNPIPGQPTKVQGWIFTVVKKPDGTLRYVGDSWRTYAR